MCSRIRSRSARARIRSGSTRCCSTPANCGAKLPIRNQRSRSKHGILTLSPPNTIDPTAARRAAEAVPSIPCDAKGPVFREPWEAQAFAMALALHERGPFTWLEWAATLSDEIRRAQAAGDPDTGETYYRHWLNTLERLVT